jgi:hypothetical protein
VVEEDSEKIINRYMVAHGGGSSVTSQDTTSITQNGLRELFVNNTTLGNAGAATSFANSYIAENKQAKDKIQITVNSEYRYNGYTLEDIQVGDRIEVVNIDREIRNLQIQKIEYNVDKVKLDLETIETLASEILS